mmetsp:Transcript_14420/g.39068  ORF Transcript_14420/g.39068 Transcript_14420/m.39068 type:complete len:684 (+) Transcript_14420:662-2713(+)
MKCDDLPPIQSSARRFQRTVMIIPPVRNEEGRLIAAKNVNAYLLPLLQDLQRLGPAYTGPDVSRFDEILGSVPPEEIGQGTTVTPTVKGGHGQPASAAPVKVHLVCLGFHADGPARVALMNAMGLTAFLGCLCCKMTQICATAKRKFFMGYATAVQITRGMLKGQQKQMVRDDATLKFSTPEQLNRARQAEDIPHERHAFVGVHGECKIQQLLWYMDYNRICYSPFVHSFYCGVFRDWMLGVCSSLTSLNDIAQVFPFEGKAPVHLRPEHALSTGQRAEMKKRMRSMVFTNEFSRIPECPLTYGKQQVMEQLIRLLDCVLPVLFAGVLQDTPNRTCPIKKSFGHLRRFADFHMRVHAYLPHESQLRRTHLQEARKELLEFAKMAKTDLALDFLSTNLHHLLCVLTDQALAVGDTRGYLELWVERIMGFVKRKTKFRSTMDPEKVAVCEIGLQLGLERLKEGAPDSVLEPCSLLSTCFQSSTLYVNVDDGPRPSNGSFLLGTGIQWNERKHGMTTLHLLQKGSSELVGSNAIDCHGWPEDLLADPSSLRIYVHERAMLNDQEVLTSRSYMHERSRDSCHVSTTYVAGDDGSTRDHIAVVRNFVCINHADVDIFPLRFALVDFYVYKEPIVDLDLGTIHRVGVQEFDSRECNFPLLFSALNHKLVHCTSSGTRYLVKYNIASELY